MSDYIFKPEDVNVASWGSTRKGSWSLDDRVGIQVIHLPTGTVVQVESERSQHGNRAVAFDKLNEILGG